MRDIRTILSRTQQIVKKAWTAIETRAQALRPWLKAVAVKAAAQATQLRSAHLPDSTRNLIKNAMLLAACLVVAAAIVLWTRRNILKFEKENIAKVNQYMHGIAQEKGQCVEQFIQETQDYLALLARKPFSGEFKKGQPLPYNAYLAGEALLEHVEGKVDSIYRIDSKGMVLHRTPYKKNSIGKDFSKMPGIQYVLDKQEPHVSEVFEFAPGQFGFHLCQPVFEADHFLGVMCLLMPLQTLDRSVCHIQAASAGEIWIINSEGLLVSHPNLDLIGRNIIGAESAIAPDRASGFPELVRKMTSGEEGHGVYYSSMQTGEKLKQVKKAAVFLPIRLQDQVWSLAITMDYDEIAAPVKRNARNNFLGAILMMLMLGAVGAYHYRNQKKKSELEAIACSAEELRISNEKLKHEIQQRNQAEKAREVSESNYRLLAENVLDIIWIADLSLRFTYISPSVAHMLGLNASEMIGWQIQSLLSPTSLETAKKALLEELSISGRERTDNMKARAVDLEIYRKDGAIIWAETKFSFLYDSDETFSGLLGITRDITEKLQLQQQFFQAQKMESIGTLAGGIAHDFNNLLGGILGYASLMKTKAHEPVVIEYANTIEKSANRAAELTAQLLAFARGGRYEPKVLSLNRIIEETLELIRRTFDKSIEILAHLDQTIPTIEADAGQIQQVLMNLCVNARDAMPDGGRLTIDTCCQTLAKGPILGAKSGRYVVLSVTDTGIGMDAETKARIFEPFFTTKEKGKGTGLGLSMVYGVIKNHGGCVRVESKPGKGSSFSIHLPASGKAEIIDVDKPRVVQGGSELILVVDDEEIIRFLAKDVLESYGYRVLLAKDGIEALSVFRENNGGIGLVIIDMIMPRMGGRETFRKLKELNPRVRALLATGYDRNGEAREILRSGVLGFIQKPFQLEELLLKVRSALDE